MKQQITLDLIPMVKMQSGGSGQGKNLLRWHIHSANSTPVRQIRIKPKCTEPYPASGPDQIKDKVYYVPKAPNQVAFDSFIMAKKKLYIFQFTGSDHPIKNGTIPFFSQYKRLPAKADWYFVYVVPPGSGVSCPQTWDPDLKALPEMNLCFAVTDPEDK